jgi:hypothetical protein
MGSISLSRQSACVHVFTIVLTALPAIASAAAINVPEKLQTTATQHLALEAHAEGVQIYACKVGTDGKQSEWVLKAPDAILYDAEGIKVGTHYAGPTWQSTDGSKVVGIVKSSFIADPDSIPWLLLGVKSTEGNGIFSKVVAVQRLTTESGKAPNDSCDSARLGNELRVPYKAVYRFYKQK